MKQTQSHTQTSLEMDYRPLSLHVSRKRNFDRVFYATLMIFVIVLVGLFVPYYIKSDNTNTITGTGTATNPWVVTPISN